MPDEWTALMEHARSIARERGATRWRVVRDVRDADPVVLVVDGERIPIGRWHG